MIKYVQLAHSSQFAPLSDQVHHLQSSAEDMFQLAATDANARGHLRVACCMYKMSAVIPELKFHAALSGRQALWAILHQPSELLGCCSWTGSSMRSSLGVQQRAEACLRFKAEAKGQGLHTPKQSLWTGQPPIHLRDMPSLREALLWPVRLSVREHLVVLPSGSW